MHISMIMCYPNLPYFALVTIRDLVFIEDKINNFHFKDKFCKDKLGFNVLLDIRPKSIS